MKNFPEPVQCDDNMIKEAGGSETLLKTLWSRFPSLKSEFTDYDCFASYAKSLAAGQSSICTPGKVVRSGESESKSFLAN